MIWVIIIAGAAALALIEGIIILKDKWRRPK